MKRIILTGLLGAAVLNVGYADASAGAQVIRLNADQQTVDVALPANATTGYQWFVQNYDHDLLILQDYRYVPKSVPKGVVGSGGTAIFTFTIDPRFYDGPQITQVNFVYEQPWNAGQNVQSTQVTVLSTSSNNDTDSWQKYPDNLGPGAASSDESLYNDANQIQAAAAGAASTASASAVSVSNSGAMQVGGVNAATPQAKIKKPASAAPTSGVGVQETAQNAPASGNLPVSGANNQWLNLSPAEAQAASNANATASKPVPNSSTTSSNVVVPAPTGSTNNGSQTQWLSLPAASTTTNSSTSNN